MLFKKVLLFIPLLMTAVTPVAGGSAPVFIKTASHIALDTSKLAKKIKIPENCPWEISITVYRYTTGTDILSLGSDETVRESSRGGEARALVMIFRNKILIASGFVLARGEEADDLMATLGEKISGYLATVKAP